MDVLSLAANLIAVIDAAAAVAQRLERLGSLKGAPAQLLQVVNEVSDIRTVLIVVQQTCEELESVDSNDQDISTTSKLRELLLKAKKNLAFFDGVLQKITPDNQANASQPPKVSWSLWTRERKEIHTNLTALRNVKRTIMEVLTILQASNIPKVQVRMAEISSGQMEIRRIFNSVQENVEQLEVMRNQNNDTNSRQLEGLQGRFLDLPMVSNPSEPRRHSGNTGSAIRVPATVHRQEPCREFCMCRCHRKTTLKSPPWLENLLGTLFIGYTAVLNPMVPTCNERMCTQNQNKLITVSYYFPSWLLKRALLVCSRSNPMDGCIIGIRTPRIVSAYSPQILLSQAGNVTEVQKLFSQGLASPFDIDDKSGASCLQYAVGYSHVEMCKLLLSEHADPNHLDRSSTSCVRIIWKSEKEGTWSPAMEAIKDLFRESLEDYNPKQELNLTILHQIILGVTVLDLRTQLSLTTAGIDTCDSIGRTPLMWAAARSDLNAMRLLLDFGANLEIPDSYNRNVFHIAGRYGSSEALKLLLEYIANSPVPENMQRDAYYARLLNRPDIYENTPLCQTTFACRTDHSLLLLEFPCTINPPNPELSPLLASIQSNDHEVVKRLLVKGGRTDIVDEEKMSILHFAAQFGDLETISTLLRHQDPPLKANAVSIDMFGNTPMRSFLCMRRKYRISYIEEDEESFARCREAFESLLNKVNSYQMRLH